MKNFAIASIVAVAAVSAQDRQSFKFSKNSRENGYTMYYRDQEWSTAEPSTYGVDLAMNNSIVLHDGTGTSKRDLFTTYIRGGAIEYDVDVSSMGCGCVAGLYLVSESEQCIMDGERTDNADCPQLDVMQANPYGFNTQAHPNGDSGASQCAYDMAVEGKEQYGEGAYGPGGSLIDTNREFHVKTEFLSTNAY